MLVVFVQNSIHLGGSIVDIGSIVGKGVREEDAQCGGGSKSNDSAVPGEFGEETKVLEVSPRYLFYTLSFRGLIDSHT